MLRVIDNASQTCDSNESNLNWDQTGVRAFARVTYSAGTYAVDTNRSYNIASFYEGSSSFFGNRLFCFSVNGTPKNISVLFEADNGNYNVKRAAVKDSSGWTSADGAACDSASPGSNVALIAGSNNFFITIH